MVSVALYGTTRDGDAVRAERSVEISRSSRRLLEMVDEVLEETGLGMADVTGFVALRGPGSFTGLRVGLATVMGFHQALGTPSTAISTLEVLAAAPMARSEGTEADTEVPGGRVVGLVDVLRSEWTAQPFDAGWPPRSQREAERLGGEELARFAPCALMGFGLDKLREETDLGQRENVVFLDPPPLAAVAARLVADHPPAWDSDLLSRPLYFRPPPVTLPKRRPGTPRRKP